MKLTRLLSAILLKLIATPFFIIAGLLYKASYKLFPEKP